MMLPILLLLAQAGAPAPDSITVEIVTGGTDSTGWTLRADGSGQSFRKAPGRGTSDFVAGKGTYAFVAKKLAEYRRLAREGAGCPIAAGDALAYRFTWVEHGARRTATFSDSCGGTPQDIFAKLRPIGERIDRLIARPPGPDAPDPQ